MSSPRHDSYATRLKTPPYRLAITPTLRFLLRRRSMPRLGAPAMVRQAGAARNIWSTSPRNSQKGSAKWRAPCAIIRALKAGEELDWNSSEEGVRMDLGEERLGSTQAEVAHGLFLPTAYYAIVENLLRARAGRSVQDHREKIGRLMAPFSEVAARHPQAWFPIARSAQEIAEPSKNNRYVGFPYTKYMNAIMQVDQGAALLMTSVGKAREMGIPREKWIFIHGTAHAHDIWHLSERERLDASPALRAVGGKALEMARWDIKDVDYFDLYSCFPSAVEVAQQELGIDEEDPRPLTVTGGLPYFGGCGNNYTMHAIATMMEKLRRHPQAKGLCTGNSYYLTRHAVGLYSAAPPEAPWTAPNMKALQSALDKAVSSPVAALPEGRAKIESWTVLHGREGAEEGIVIGRLLKDGARFIANTPPLGDALRGWMEKETLERVGEVMPDPSRKGRNLFLAD